MLSTLRPNNVAARKRVRLSLSGKIGEVFIGMSLFESPFLHGGFVFAGRGERIEVQLFERDWHEAFETVMGRIARFSGFCSCGSDKRPIQKVSGRKFVSTCPDCGRTETLP